jgi:hypothetical protein
LANPATHPWLLIPLGRFNRPPRVGSNSIWYCTSEVSWAREWSGWVSWGSLPHPTAAAITMAHETVRI